MGLRIGVLLSGCGAMDGSDLHEAVFTLLALDRLGVETICAAPSDDQHHTVNHMNQEEMDQSRNMMVESARIARGNIIALTSLDSNRLDGVIIPGGYGAVKNLCDFALDGPSGQIDPIVQRILEEAHTARRPIGATGIAAALLVRVLGGHQPGVTIGDDGGIASALEAMGGKHYPCTPGHIYVDDVHNIVTTPASMVGKHLNDVWRGIDRLTRKVVELTS